MTLYALAVLLPALFSNVLRSQFNKLVGRGVISVTLSCIISEGKAESMLECRTAQEWCWRVVARGGKGTLSGWHPSNDSKYVHSYGLRALCISLVSFYTMRQEMSNLIVERAVQEGNNPDVWSSFTGLTRLWRTSSQARYNLVVQKTKTVQEIIFHQ